MGRFVLDLFDRFCGRLARVLGDEDEASGDTVVEVEARVGTLVSAANGNGRPKFVPGVNERFFKGMLDVFQKKANSGRWMRADDRESPVQMQHTDVVDVIFDTKVRVSAHLTRAANEKVNDVEVLEVIEKRKDENHVEDFRIVAPQHGDKLHLRIGVAMEESIRPSSQKYKNYEKAAKDAIMEAFNVSTKTKLLGGIELQLKSDVKQVQLTFPFTGEQLARGPLGRGDPFYVDANKRENMLDGRLASQLKWTLVFPANLPALKGYNDVHLRDKEDLDTKFFVTNLPGIVTLKDGSKYPTFACQYIIRVRVSDVLCGHGRFSKGPKPGSNNGIGDSSEPPLNVEVFRRKVRWSFEVRKNQRLELTKTRQSPNLVTLDHEPAVYEVEIERTLAPPKPGVSREETVSEIKAARIADAFLSDISSRIFGHALPVLDVQKTSSIWKEQLDKDEKRIQGFWKSLKRPRPPPPMKREDSFNSQEESQKQKRAKWNLEDDQQASAGFYNQLDRSSISKRHDSIIYHQRNLSNFVKSVSIKEALIRSLNDTGREPGSAIRVLDLACGKGADLRKITEAARSRGVPIDFYVGVDIARKSLDDAIARVDNLSDRDKPTFPMKFVVADLGQHHLSTTAGSAEDVSGLDQWDSETALWERRPPSSTLKVDMFFDLVSMQFSLHYMFQNRDRADHFFSMIGRHMKTGSVFIATTVYADEMINKLLQSEPGSSEFRIKDEFNTELCHVKFDPNFRKTCFKLNLEQEKNGAFPPSSGDQFGIRYNFILRDGEEDASEAVNAPEWLVPQQLLMQVATAHNFKLVRYERLPNCAKRHIDHDRSRRDALFRSMSVLNHKGTMSEAEWEIASLYVVVELQKEDAPRDTTEALTRLKERIPNYRDLPAQSREHLMTTLTKDID